MFLFRLCDTAGPAGTFWGVSVGGRSTERCVVILASVVGTAAGVGGWRRVGAEASGRCNRRVLGSIALLSQLASFCAHRRNLIFCRSIATELTGLPVHPLATRPLHLEDSALGRRADRRMPYPSGFVADFGVRPQLLLSRPADRGRYHAATN